MLQQPMSLRSRGFFYFLLSLALFLFQISLARAVEPDGPPFKFKPTSTTKYIKVTSLADSGRGSLRECVLTQGSRVCLFEIAGTINLYSDIVIKYSNILIAGQTAPAPGITLARAGIAVQAKNVEIQHIAIRPGDSRTGSSPDQRNGLAVGGYDPRLTYSVSLKNLSLTWAIDENFSTWSSVTHDIWLQNSIIAEGLNDSIHSKGPHSAGVLVGINSQRLTMNGNLIAFNFDRNPYLEPGTSTKMTNNLVYGWGDHGPWNICNLTNNFDTTTPLIAAIIGNVWIPAPFSYQQDATIYSSQIVATSQVYLQDNYGPGRWSDSDPESAIASLSDPSVITTTCPFSTGCTATLKAADVESYVLKNAGSRPKQRSSIDRRIVSDVQNRKGSIKDCLTGCTNAAGRIPSTSPTRRRLTVPSNPTGDSDNDGISNFDEWLFGYTAQVEYV